MIKFVDVTVFYTNFNKEEMLWKRVEICKKCLVKVKIVTEHAEDGSKNYSILTSSGRPYLVDHNILKTLFVTA